MLFSRNCHDSGKSCCLLCKENSRCDCFSCRETYRSLTFRRRIFGLADLFSREFFTSRNFYRAEISLPKRQAKKIKPYNSNIWYFRTVFKLPSYWLWLFLKTVIHSLCKIRTSIKVNVHHLEARVVKIWYKKTIPIIIIQSKLNRVQRSKSSES